MPLIWLGFCFIRPVAARGPAHNNLLLIAQFPPENAEGLIKGEKKCPGLLFFSKYSQNKALPQPRRFRAPQDLKRPLLEGCPQGWGWGDPCSDTNALLRIGRSARGPTLSRPQFPHRENVVNNGTSFLAWKIKEYTVLPEGPAQGGFSVPLCMVNVIVGKLK